MLVQRRKLWWLAITSVVVTFIGLLWTSAGTKAIAPRADNFSNAAAATPSKTIAEAKATDSATQGKSQKERLGAEVITITRRGFEPAEVSRSNGHFFLAIENRSGIGELNLRLTRETGNAVSEAHLTRGANDWYGEVNLPAGNYVLTEANHSNWVCHITVSGN